MVLLGQRLYEQVKNNTIFISVEFWALHRTRFDLIPVVTSKMNRIVVVDVVADNVVMGGGVGDVVVVFY